MENISLNGVWSLYYAPEKGGKPDAYTPAFKESWKKIDGAVPGNVQLDLVNAGIEGDPFYGENLHDFNKYEYYQFLYERTFTAPADWGSDAVILRFDGVDTVVCKLVPPKKAALVELNMKALNLGKEYGA